MKYSGISFTYYVIILGGGVQSHDDLDVEGEVWKTIQLVKLKAAGMIELIY